jgi:hypothetical protein
MTDSILSNMLGSACAGTIMARCLTHSLDTAKARLQAGSGTQIYQGPFDVLRKTMKTEGISGLYRGFSTVIVGGTPGTIIYLCSYDIFKKRLSGLFHNDDGKAMKNGNENFTIHFTSGIMAEAVACLVYVPVDFIKERLQVQHRGDSLNYKGGWDALVKISRTEGLSGIYKGYAATLASFGPFSALYFVLYERFKLWSTDFSKSESLPFPWIILSSASAGALASWITSPLDMAKLRLQVQRGGLASSSPLGKTGPSSFEVASSFSGVWDCLNYSCQKDGVRGLFRGAGARVLHFVPATTVTMTCYESFRPFFKKAIYEP